MTGMVPGTPPPPPVTPTMAAPAGTPTGSREGDVLATTGAAPSEPLGGAMVPTGGTLPPAAVAAEMAAAEGMFGMPAGAVDIVPPSTPEAPAAAGTAMAGGATGTAAGPPIVTAGAVVAAAGGAGAEGAEAAASVDTILRPRSSTMCGTSGFDPRLSAHPGIVAYKVCSTICARFPRGKTRGSDRQLTYATMTSHEGKRGGLPVPFGRSRRAR